MHHIVAAESLERLINRALRQPADLAHPGTRQPIGVRRQATQNGLLLRRAMLRLPPHTGEVVARLVIEIGGDHCFDIGAPEAWLLRLALLEGECVEPADQPMPDQLHQVRLPAGQFPDMVKRLTLVIQPKLRVGRVRQH